MVRSPNVKRSAGNDDDMSLDKRLAWLEARIVSSFKAKSMEVRKVLEAEESKLVLGPFLDGEQEEMLYVTILSGHVRLSLTPFPAPQKKTLIIQKLRRERVGTESIGTLLTMQEMSPMVVDTLEILLKDTFPQLAANDESLKALGQPVVTALLEELALAAGMTHVQLGAMRGSTWLAPPVVDARGDISMGRHDLEATAAKWMRQIRGAIARDDVLHDVMEDVRPLKLCQDWDNRLTDLRNIVQQVNGPQFQQVLGGLDRQSSTFTFPLQQLAQEVEDLEQEISKGCRWLNPLVQHFESINADSPERVDYPQLIKHNVFPILFHLLFVMWSECEVFRSPRRIGPIIAGVFHDLVEYSSQYMSLDQFFVPEPQETLSRINTVLLVCGQCKVAYYGLKNKAMEQHLTWELDHAALLRSTDVFLERCHDVIEAIEAKLLLNWAATVEPPGISGMRFVASVKILVDDYTTQYNKFAGNGLMAIGSLHDSTFDDHSDELRQNVLDVTKKIAETMQNFIVSQPVTPGLYKTVKHIRQFFIRPVLQPLWDGIVEDLQQKVIADLVQLQKEWQSMRNDPPSHPTLPPLMQKIQMCLVVLHRVKQPAELLRSWGSLGKAEVVVHTLMDMVHGHIKDLYRDWLASGPSAMASLQSHLLRQSDDGRFYVQLSDDVVQRIREASALRQLIFSPNRVVLFSSQTVPNEVQQLLDLEEPIRRRYIGLREVAVSLNKILFELPEHEAQLFKHEVAIVRERVKPGLQTLRWESGGEIDVFVETTTALLNKLSSALVSIREEVQNVEDYFSKLGKSSEEFVPLLHERVGDKAFLSEDFFYRYRTCQEGRNARLLAGNGILDSALNANLRTLNTLKEELETPLLTDESDPWKGYTLHVHNLVLVSSKNFVLLLLNNLRSQFDEDWIDQHGGMPLLDVKLHVESIQKGGAQSGSWNPNENENTGGDSQDDDDDDDEGRRRNKIELLPPYGDYLLGQIESLVADVVAMPKVIKCVYDESWNYADLLSREPDILQLRQEVTKLLERTGKQVRQLKGRFADYNFMVEGDVVKQLMKQLHVQRIGSMVGGYLDSASFFGLTIEEIDSQIRQYQATTEKLSAIQAVATLGWLRVDVRPLKDALHTIAVRLRQTLINHVTNRIESTMTEVQEFVERVRAGLDSEFDGNVETFRKTLTLIQSMRQRNTYVKDMFEPIDRAMKLLARHHGASSDMIRNLAEMERRIPTQWDLLYRRGQAVREQLSSMQDTEVEKMKIEVAGLDVEMARFRERFLQSRVFLPDITPDLAYGMLDDLIHIDVKEMDDKHLRVKQLQDLYDMNVVEYPSLVECHDEAMLAKHIWDVRYIMEAQLEAWMATPFIDIDCDDIIEELRRLRSQLKRMHPATHTWDIFTWLDTRLKELSLSFGLVHDLKGQALRERHWDELLSFCAPNSTINPFSPSFTLHDVLQLNLYKYATDVSTICDRAEKEMQIEKTLDRVTSFWQAATLKMVHNGTVQSWVLPPIENILEFLDDHLSVLQALLANRWIGHFQQGVASWQQNLTVVDITMKLWADLQKQWISLQPIFLFSVDMRTQLPDDTAAFEVVDGQIKQLMKAASSVSNIVTLCCSNTVGKKLQRGDVSIADILGEIQDVLLRCEKKLADYLEAKRMIFPRFYFLSNADLVDILSKASNPVAVCAHISKIIGAVESCKFLSVFNMRADDSDEDDDDFDDDRAFESTSKPRQKNVPTQIVSVTSVEGEELTLPSTCHCVGPAENYLQDLVDATQEAVRTQIAESNNLYNEVARLEWMGRNIAQAVIVVTRVQWTGEVSQAFEAAEDGNVSALGDLAKMLCTQVAQTVEMVMQDLTPQRRKMLISLITVDVHSRDIVVDFAAKHVDSSYAFAWQSQLRFFLATTTSPCQVRICDASFTHGGEYIGNCGCLVITPLTDRCYITLTQALRLHKGGAPAGPAGTGKTETVKDLAHAMGIPCYVFNCSDQMDYRSVGSIMKGLTMSGAWGCFDEFNRIAVEVLSVVASQVKAVLEGLRRKGPRFNFMGDDLPIKHSVGIFVTMNPGYKGRTELPENVKALFRPCAMVVPDVLNICEIMLSAEGFTQGKDLSKKFIKLYELNKELLSKQEHYDWGLRAIKSVLLSAGSLKRRDPDLDETGVLMRALRDANLAKLVKDDVAVFLRLIAALFPGINAPPLTRKGLTGAVETAAKTLGYSLGEDQIVVDKCSKLVDLLEVRHSVFVMGVAGCGKTTVRRLLAKALEVWNGERTATEEFDPKAITVNELYGFVHEQTREWHDGVLSKVFRDYATQSKSRPGPKWIVFDGSIDAEWIESMNSVMDDNKLLTLASNERIAMTPNMRLMFEISHLNGATPATVSRAGILYLNAADIGWIPMKDRWISLRSSDREKSHLDILFDKHVGNLVDYSEKYARLVLPHITCQCLQSLCNYLDGVLSRPEMEHVSSEHYERVFLWCCVWAFGGLIVPGGDGSFDARQHFSTMFKREYPSARFPESGTVFDYVLEPGGEDNELEFVHWSDKVKDNIDGTLPFSSIIVSTPETCRNAYLMDLVLRRKQPAMIVGPAGCGKSAAAIQYCSTLDEAASSYAFIYLDAHTDSARLQGSLDQLLEKRGGRQYGPQGRKELTIVLEDLNMPQPDKYGSQSTTAFLRQHIDKGYWFDRNKFNQMDIVDVNYIAVENYKAGSVDHVDSRLQRHFTAIAIGLPKHDALIEMYTRLFEAVAEAKHIELEMTSIIPALVQATVELWSSTMKFFPPTSGHFHHIYSLREISNTIRGVLSIPPNARAAQAARLWFHEVQREFSDRFNTEGLQRRFHDVAKSIAVTAFSDIPRNDQIATEPFVYGFFGKLDPATETRAYIDLVDYQSVADVLHERLSEYNTLSNTNLDLVLFEQAMQHVLHIARVLSYPASHALLVGIGGIGKQTLARLGAYCANCDVVVARAYSDPQEFLSVMQSLFRRCGVKNQTVAYIIRDTQMLHPDIIIHINDFLSSGYITSIFSAEEREDVEKALAMELRAAGHPHYGSTVVCWRAFIKKLRHNLRFCICISPVGGHLQQWFQRYPSVANKTSLIWFGGWPEEALVSVAERALRSSPYIHRDDADAVAAHAAFTHTAVGDACESMFKAEKRRSYITPNTFLSFIEVFKDFLSSKTEELESKRSRLDLGLVKLNECRTQVAELEEVLEQEQIIVNEKVVSVNELLEKVSMDRAHVEEQSSIAKAEEAKTNVIVGEVNNLVSECEGDLAAARPIVEQALAALNTLNKSNLTELKSMQKPPADIHQVTACVMCLMALPGRIPRDRSWGASKKMMTDVSKWMKELLEFDVNNIPQANVDACLPIVEKSSFNPGEIASKSVAASSLCAWVINVTKYHAVRCMVKPKEERLAEAQIRLNMSKNHLKKAQAKVNDLTKKLQTLIDKYNAAVAEKEEMEERARRTAEKMHNAQRLLSGLADEEERWGEGQQRLKGTIGCVAGDMIQSAAFVTYAGPFTNVRRSDLQKIWYDELKKKGIATTITCDDVVGTLYGEASIAAWNNDGLHTDAYSVQNAAIVLKCHKPPLLIDPQVQGVLWVRKRGLSEGLVVAEPGKFFQRTLIECVEDGKPCLVENITTIPSILQPILAMAVIVRSTGSYIMIGDREVKLHPKFRLILQTSLPNPVYRPELYAQCTVVNFNVTQSGLEEQFLSAVVNYERADLEESRIKLMQHMNNMVIQLDDCETVLLRELTNAEGDLLENSTLVQTLEDTKIKAKEIHAAMEAAEESKVQLQEARGQYRDVAVRGALIYFQLNKLYRVDVMYEYSLDSYASVFRDALSALPLVEGMRVDVRVTQHMETVTQNSFAFVSRSLFSRHKLLFSALLCFAILGEEHIPSTQLHFLLKAPRAMNVELPHALAEWLTGDQWAAIVALGMIGGTTPRFENLTEDLQQHNRWRHWVEHEKPEAERMPGDWKSLTAFQRLLVIRCLRSDRLTAALVHFIVQSIGSYYAEDPQASLEDVLKDSSEFNPILLVLSPGADPGKQAEGLARQYGFTEDRGNYTTISLGQGQEKMAERQILTGYERGHWVMLQNVHLMKVWVTELEKMLHHLKVGGVDAGATRTEHSSKFRLFLTAEPSEALPVALIQRSIKYVNEPPTGLKQNFVRAYKLFADERWEASTKPQEHHNIIYLMSFFHACAVERQRFGPQGWNRKYPFNFEDLISCTDVLSNYLEERPRIPWDDLRFVFGEIMYGGHITDPWDRRLCMTYLEEFIRSDIFEEIEIAPGIPLPLTRSHAETLQTINETFPPESTTLFQLPASAETNCRAAEANFLFKSLLDVTSSELAETGRSDDVLSQIVQEVAACVPEAMSLEDITERLEDERTPYQHVFYQECQRMEALSSSMRSVLTQCDAVVKGVANPTPAIQAVLDCFLVDRVPPEWQAHGIGVSRPLGSWTAMLAEASQQLSTWVLELLNPKVVMINLFFSPIAFLTSIMQETAMRTGYELDQMALVTDITKKTPDHVDMPAREGCFFYGPYLEGARWDTNTNSLQEARLKEPFHRLPVMNIRSMPSTKIDRRDSYACPMYATAERGTSYITTLHLKTKAPNRVWVMAGAAVILDLA